jgi:dihydroflavonol-4-reductase
MSRVLVSGGSGFIGAHCVLQLLADGYDVVATIRSSSRGDALRNLVARTGRAYSDGQLKLVVADLNHDEGWDTAASGCDFVIHVASPFPGTAPRNESELIKPAVNGTIRVLKAACHARVRRVVLTSSISTIVYARDPTHGPFTEVEWTDPDAAGLTAYVRAKTLAERAAWNFVSDAGAGIELAVINPAGVYGPVLCEDVSTSIRLVHRLLTGTINGCPDLWFGVVDVRDVVDLHLRAMRSSAASGERFIAMSGDAMSVIDVARLLISHCGRDVKSIPTRRIPNWLVRLSALRDPIARQILPELGVRRAATSEKATRILGWQPTRTRESAITATADSLRALGLISHSSYPEVSG